MSLVNTRIQNIRVKGNYDKYEYRGSRYGGLDLFMQQTSDPSGIMSSEMVERAKSSIGNTFETPVINFNDQISITHKRTVEIADSENTSEMKQFTFTTYTWGFTIAPALYMNNEIKMQEDFEKKFLGYLYKFYETMDQACIAQLSANATQVLRDKLLYKFPGGTVLAPIYQVEVPYENRVNIIGDINPMMHSNDFYGGLHLVADTGLESTVRKLAQHSIYNDVNKTLEYNDKTLHFTNNISRGSTEFSKFFAVAGGSTGLMTRFERECLLETETEDGHEWSKDTLPGENFPIGTYYYGSVGDYNTMGGTATTDWDRGYKQHFGFAIDVCTVVAYNSKPASRPNPIIQVSIANPTTTSTSEDFE